MQQYRYQVLLKIMTKIISFISNQAALYCIDVLKIKQDSEFYRNIAAKFTSQTANFPLLQIQVVEFVGKLKAHNLKQWIIQVLRRSRLKMIKRHRFANNSN